MAENKLDELKKLAEEAKDGGDKEKYRVVVHYSEELLRLFIRDRVVKRAHTVEDDKARAEYRASDYRPYVAVNSGKHN